MSNKPYILYNKTDTGDYFYLSINTSMQEIIF